MLPDPVDEIAAAYEIRLLIDRIIRLPASTGMSAVEAATVESEPNRIYPIAVVVLVTTTESPPPAKGALDETLLTSTVTVPVGRNGLTEPRGIACCSSVS